MLKINERKNTLGVGEIFSLLLPTRLHTSFLFKIISCIQIIIITIIIIIISRRRRRRRRTNYIKAKIDKTQENSKCRLCSDRDETINHIISECSKLAQKEYKTRPNCVGKVIYWEMCNTFKFDHTSKWYMHNPTLVLENEGTLTYTRIT